MSGHPPPPERGAGRRLGAGRAGGPVGGRRGPGDTGLRPAGGSPGPAGVGLWPQVPGASGQGAARSGSGSLARPPRTPPSVRPAGCGRRAAGRAGGGGGGAGTGSPPGIRILSPARHPRAPRAPAPAPPPPL